MLTFRYCLDGTGWSAARISDGRSTAEPTASYLSDALGDLLRALESLCRGSATARCSWTEEPGEYRWVFRPVGELVELRLLWFVEVWGKKSDSEGTVVFETRQPLHVIVKAVVDGAAALLDEVGEAEYRKRWVEHDFPTQLLLVLRLWIGEQDN